MAAIDLNLRKALYYSAHRLIGSSLGSVYERYLREDTQGIPQNIVGQSLVAMLDHCKRNVPYYSNVIAGLGGDYQPDPISYLQHFPILTKDTIRKNFADLTSTDLSKRRWNFNTSGGSTGEPIKLIQDRQHLDRQTAIALLSFNWAGRAFGEPAVRIWGSERDILQGSMGPKMKILNQLTNDRYLNAFHMTPTKMRAFLEILNANPPKLIVAYAQAVYELAGFAETEKINIVPQSAILTSAGTLYPFMREKLETVFGCKVFNHYGSREVGPIACECQLHTGLHVFPWGNFVEIVDDEGHPAPHGLEGNIVVTCLTNFAMPLIRYAIGDRGTLSLREECLCGRRGQILERVSGRSVDAFWTQDGTLIDGEYFTHLLYFRDWVHKFQVVQTDHSRIVFRIVKSDSDCLAHELDEIVEKTRVVMGPNCKVEFEFPADIAPSASGKYRYTISEVQR